MQSDRPREQPSGAPAVAQAALPTRGGGPVAHLDYKRHLVILVIGALLMFAGSWFRDFVDQTFVHAEPASAVIPIPIVILRLLERGAHLLTELGVAFVIAFIVTTFVELRAQKAHIASLEAAREQIEKDVSNYMAHLERRFEANMALADRKGADLIENAILGAYATKFDITYVRTAIDTVFGAGVMRDAYDLDFRLSRLSREEAEGFGVDPDQFVKLTAEANYRMTNVTHQPLSWTSRYSVPIRRDVPQANRLEDLHLDGRKYSKGEIDVVVEIDEVSNERDYCFKIQMDRGESIKIMTRSILLKDLSDNEPFGFIHPTTGLTLNVSSEIPILEVGANARTASPMAPSKTSIEKRYGEWKIDGAILPHDSVVIWWRPRNLDRSSAVEPTTGNEVYPAEELAESALSPQGDPETEPASAQTVQSLQAEQSGGRSSNPAAPTGGVSPQGGAE